MQGGAEEAGEEAGVGHERILIGQEWPSLSKREDGVVEKAGVEIICGLFNLRWRQILKLAFRIKRY